VKKIILGLVLASSLLFSYSIDFDKNTTCLVRHLKVHKEPQWASKIELQNGKKIFFSSPKSMFEFYFRPGKWFDIGVKNEDDLKDILVTDFKTLKPMLEVLFTYMVQMLPLLQEMTSYHLALMKMHKNFLKYITVRE